MISDRVPAPVPQFVRLHCRFCGSALSRPMREMPEDQTHPRSAGHFSWLYRPGSEADSTGSQRPDSRVGVIVFKRRDLDGGARPLVHHPDRIGCCGFAGGTEPNIKCNRCGHWVLVDIEDCQARRMTAARTTEVVLRPVESKRT